MTDQAEKSIPATLRLPWQVALWVITMIFCAAAVFTTFEARTYVDNQIDKKMNPIGEQLTKIQVDQATILEWIRNQDNQKQKK